MIRYLLILLVILGFPARMATACSDERVILQGPWGMAEFEAELALTSDARMQGLMWRENLPMFSGMLFVFVQPAFQTFWMKNTLIPLDILFFDGDGQLINIRRNAQPGDLAPQVSNGPAQFVFEINAGMSDRLRIARPTQILHPLVNGKIETCKSE